MNRSGFGGMQGRGGILIVAAVALLASCGQDECSGHPAPCPASESALTVTDTAGQAVSDVEATLSGVALSCASSANGTVCFSRGGASGPLHVEAPGFQPVDVNATVSETAGSACGCASATLTPAHVTLQPS